MRPFDQIAPTTLAAAYLSILAAVSCGPGQSPPPPPSPEVATLTVQPQVVELTTELPGRTSAFRIAEIRPQVSGLIQKRLFTEGSDVKAGQVLYQIDPAPLQAALDNAKAALDRAEANLPAIQSRAKRFEEVLADKAVSQQDYDDVVAELKQAQAEVDSWKAQVKTASINLAYTNVTAPISGRIGRSNVTAGAIVTAYQATPLATIQQLHPIYVDVPQATTELLQLREEMLKRNRTDQNKVTLILEDGTVYSSEGTLQFRDVTVDPTTGSVILRVVFPNPDGVLLPGMFVRAVIKEGATHAMLIPQQGVSHDHKGNPVALIVNTDGKVELHTLTIDRAIGDKWLVAAGLAPGDRVIVEGMQKVRPDMAVTVVPFEQSETTHSAAENSSSPTPDSN